MAQKIVLAISGMDCTSCAKIIESELSDKPGINSASVDFDSKKAFLDFDPEKISLDQIKKEIEELGYKAQ